MVSKRKASRTPRPASSGDAASGKRRASQEGSPSAAIASNKNDKHSRNALLGSASRKGQVAEGGKLGSSGKALRSAFESAACHLYLVFFAFAFTSAVGSAETDPSSSRLLLCIAVMFANASWNAFFSTGAVVDVGSVVVQNALHPRATHGATKLLSPDFTQGLFGFIGAAAAGSFLAYFSPVNPLNSPPLLHQLKDKVDGIPFSSGCAFASPSQVLKLLVDKIASVEMQQSLALALMRSVTEIPAAVSSVFPHVERLLSSLTLNSMEASKSLTLLHLLMDVLIMEFFLAFAYYYIQGMAGGLRIGDSFSKVTGPIVLALLVGSGLEACQPSGGPMIGISFSALVAFSRRDVLALCIIPATNAAGALAAAFILRRQLAVARRTGG